MNDKSKQPPAPSREDVLVPGILADTLALDERAMMDSAREFLTRLRRFSKPVVTGVDNIPEGPVLFIGNHSTMAGDTIVVLPLLAEAAGRVVRGMNDRLFYENSRIRNWSINSGAVMGHQDIGSALFEAGKDLLVFPGGAHEANKNADLRYTLQWKERTGFLRLAARHGVPIVPMGIVGPDEWYDRYIERDDLAGSALGKLLMRAGVSEEFLTSDHAPPIPRGFLGTLFPKPKQVFVNFGKPIKTGRYRGKNISQASQYKLRDQAKESLEEAIQKMLTLRDEMRNEQRGIRSRLGWSS